MIGLTCASGALGRPAGATPAPARDAVLARALGAAPERPGDHQGTALRAREALRVISGGGSSPTQPAQQIKPAISTGRDRLQLLSQPTWVGPRQNEFRLRLAITASDSANEELSVSVYSELTARSQFQAALNGDVAGSGFYDWPAGAPCL